MSKQSNVFVNFGCMSSIFDFSIRPEAVSTAAKAIVVFYGVCVSVADDCLSFH